MKDVNELKVVTVGGLAYLGVVKGRTVEGMQANMATAEYTFRQYFKNQAMGQLVTISVGEGKDIITQDLTENQKIIFEMVRAQWNAACKHAKGWLVNQVFTEMFPLGK